MLNENLDFNVPRVRRTALEAAHHLAQKASGSSWKNSSLCYPGFSMVLTGVCNYISTDYRLWAKQTFPILWKLSIALFSVCRWDNQGKSISGKKIPSESWASPSSYVMNWNLIGIQEASNLIYFGRENVSIFYQNLEKKDKQCKVLTPIPNKNKTKRKNHNKININNNMSVYLI